MVTEPLLLFWTEAAKLGLDGPVVFQVQTVVVCRILYVSYVSLAYCHEVLVGQKLEQETSSFLDWDIRSKLALRYQTAPADDLCTQ